MLCEAASMCTYIDYINMFVEVSEISRYILNKKIFSRTFLSVS